MTPVVRRFRISGRTLAPMARSRELQARRPVDHRNAQARRAKAVHPWHKPEKHNVLHDLRWWRERATVCADRRYSNVYADPDPIRIDLFAGVAETWKALCRQV